MVRKGDYVRDVYASTAVYFLGLVNGKEGKKVGKESRLALIGVVTGFFWLMVGLAIAMGVMNAIGLWPEGWVIK